MRATRFIPYNQTDERPKKAAIGSVEIDLSPYSVKEIQLLGYLVAASNCMNGICRAQVCPDTERIEKVISSLAGEARGKERELLGDYLTVLHLQNGPWTTLPRKNHLLGISPERAAELAKAAGVSEEYGDLAGYLHENLPPPVTANFYPVDIKENEFGLLGEEGRRVNTLIKRSSDGKLHSVSNETEFGKACREAAGHLRKARSFSENPSFQLYLDAKIEELHTGSEEARRVADYHWIRHDSPIDIVISTAIEVLHDHWKNLKGAAAACVTITDRKSEKLLSEIISQVQAMEKNAPWKNRRFEIDEDALPKLKIVEVVTWSGNYVYSPMTVLAQSLPNDDWIGHNFGTVNLMYANTSRVLFDIIGSIIPHRFIPSDIISRFGGILYQAQQLHATLHEIGHTTGVQDPDHPGEPSDYFEAEYGWLEETRAELFGMWAAFFIERNGLIDLEMAIGCQYYLLSSILRALQYEPVQAHVKARNIIYHCMIEKQVFLIEGNDEGTLLRIDIDRLRKELPGLLALIGDIKASGDREAAVSLRENYCYTDELQTEIVEKIREMPQGMGFIFPEFKIKNEKFTGELHYPEFIEQKKFRI